MFVFFLLPLCTRRKELPKLLIFVKKPTNRLSNSFPKPLIPVIFDTDFSILSTNVIQISNLLISMAHDSTSATRIDLAMVTDIVNEDSEGRSDSTRVTLVGVGVGVDSHNNHHNEEESEDGSETRNLPVAKGRKVKVVQFRAANGEDGIKWVKSLNEWRDFFLLQYAERQGI